MAEPTNQGVLSPYRILDLSGERAWLCGRLLADMGADVVKVEPPGGDPGRAKGPFYHGEPDHERSLYWFGYNVNKRGVTLNLDQPQGRDLFLRLVKGADFVIESFPPGYLSGIGLDFDTLSEANPRLVMTSVTPFGRRGPYAGRKATDLVALAEGGLMAICGDEDRAPVQFGTPHAYALAGVHAAASTMIAHWDRFLTGQGRHVDVSMQEAVACSLTDIQVNWAVDQRLTRRGGRRFYGGAILETRFACKDGAIAWQMQFGGGGRGTHSGMRAIIQWMDEEGMAVEVKDVDFGNVSGLEVSQEQVQAWEGAFQRFFATKTKAEIYAGALKWRVVLFPANTAEDTLNSPQLAARGYFTQVEHQELAATLAYAGPFFRCDGLPSGIRRRPPFIGEHNREIYEQELGLTGDRLRRLREAGAI